MREGATLGLDPATEAFAPEGRHRRRSAVSGASVDNRHEPKRLNSLSRWLVEAGLRGEPDHALLNGFCERAAAAGLPVRRVLAIIDTLHPVYEGRVFRWGQDEAQPTVEEFGRTEPEGVSGLDPSSGGAPPEAAGALHARLLSRQFAACQDAFG